jgi:toluene monooxygenase system protein A
VLKREHWLDLARELDWELSYVAADDVFPSALSGAPYACAVRGGASELERSLCVEPRFAAPGAESASSSRDRGEHAKEREPVDPAWDSAVTLRAATLSLTEFATAVGQLRSARFAHGGASRATASLSALRALRRAQMPIARTAKRDELNTQLDWTRAFAHTDQWAAVAARHFIEELLLTSNPSELAIGGGFVFEAGFKRPQLAILAALAGRVGDSGYERLLHAIGEDEPGQAQRGRAFIEGLVEHDREHAQYLVDKWFWRSWLMLAFESGAVIDYLTPLARRGASFAEFVQESIVEPFTRALAELGLARPWYWSKFVEALEIYHHMLYASIYTYRKTVWFNPVLPGPAERAWLRSKYPRTWDQVEPVWECVAERWRKAGTGVEWYAHGMSALGFCNLCQLLLCGGTPLHNHAQAREYEGRKRIFCSEPCAWIFEREPWRYAAHQDLVARMLAGAAPGNLLELVTSSFGLCADTSGRDAHGGSYPWLENWP